MRPPDPAFADPRLAVLYDALDGDRSDLDAHVAIVEELAAHTVLDIGCGTGTLAVRLAATGKQVVGVDPAGASLDVARQKPHAELVTWVEGDATTLKGLGLAVDLAVMTGNVAQVFVADRDWAQTLHCVHACMRVCAQAGGSCSRLGAPTPATGARGTSRRRPSRSPADQSWSCPGRSPTSTCRW